MRSARIDGKPDKATGKALNEFRARMHFAPTAGNDELFAGLESEALKHAAPAGYTVCNDAREPLAGGDGPETAGKCRCRAAGGRFAGRLRPHHHHAAHRRCRSISGPSAKPAAAGGRAAQILRHDRGI